MRLIVAGLLALLAAPIANASFVRFEIENQVLIDNNQHVDPDHHVTLSFMADTMQWASSVYYLAPYSPCVSHVYIQGLAVSNISMTMNGDSTLWYSGSVSGGHEWPALRVTPRWLAESGR